MRLAVFGGLTNAFPRTLRSAVHRDGLLLADLEAPPGRNPQEEEAGAAPPRPARAGFETGPRLLLFRLHGDVS